MAKAKAPLTALGHLPNGLRKELLNAFEKIVRNYREGRWEPSELNGGKLCEVVYCILQGYVDGALPKRATKPQNLVDACRALEQADKSKFPRSVRIQIPRMLIPLYEIRNNRGVGHVGGDVDPNHMDSVVVLEMAKWILAELVRLFHNVTTQEATELVETIVERTTPAIWEVGGKKRVLDPDLSKKNQTLLLLYSAGKPIREKDLFEWVEHSNPSNYRRDILRRCHQKRLIEYDEDNGTVELSPAGTRFVEENLKTDI